MPTTATIKIKLPQTVAPVWQTVVSTCPRGALNSLRAFYLYIILTLIILNYLFVYLCNYVFYFVYFFCFFSPFYSNKTT